MAVQPRIDTRTLAQEVHKHFRRLYPSNTAIDGKMIDMLHVVAEICQRPDPRSDRHYWFKHIVYGKAAAA